MAEGEITTFTALTEKFNLPPGNYKKPKLLYCSNGGHFLRILPDGTVDGTRDRSDQHIQLQLSAESVGEVYIKSTETGQYLAMDTDGLLYGSLNKFTAALDSTVWMYHSPRNQSPFYGYLADTKRGMFVPGKAGGKPLQHLHIQEARREELVRWSQEEWELQTRSSDSLWAESNLVSSPARLL
ncbi:fibroblast growth factor 1 isoform X1 [Equus asinus]|uniref:Multifunctional fusion protein n=1 Tax=Equus asinus TaxID=9793 RepID=A0A9L0K7H3_EQUAS